MRGARETRAERRGEGRALDAEINHAGLSVRWCEWASGADGFDCVGGDDEVED